VRRTVLPALALAGLLAAGCEQDTRPACPAGKLCLEAGNQADPLSLDPHVSTTIQAGNVISDMFVGLVTSGRDGQPIPGMAESWTSSSDGLVWTFKLREALWSDGRPVTADDFVFAFRRVQEPAFPGEYAYLAYVIKNAEKVKEGKLPITALGIRAVDPRTLELTLEHPAPYLLQLLAHYMFAPVPAHVVRRAGEGWSKPGTMVVNGPFALAEWNLGDRIRLTRNPRFYDAANVCLDEVRYYPTVDSVSAERRVRRGELDLNIDIQSNRIAYLRQPDQIPAYVRTNTWLGVTYLAFNTNLPMFKDRRVRQALTMAIDREFIVDKMFRSGMKPAYALIPPGVANYPGGAKPYWADWPLARRQAEARRLLAEAGYGPARPLKFEIKHRNSADPVLFMPAVQADWRVIGVEVALTANEGAIAYQAYRLRDFQVADASWIADYDDPATFLTLFQSSTGVLNYADYKNPAYDALLLKGDNTADTRARGDILRQAEEMMLEDAPVAPVFFYISKNLVNPNITGWVDNIADEHRKRWLCFNDAAARRAGRG
jgi:oligopeptide transport system substrate-binding protein